MSFLTDIQEIKHNWRRENLFKHLSSIKIALYVKILEVIYVLPD